MIAIDLFLLLVMNLPPIYRSVDVIDYCKSAIKPIDTVKVEFYAFYESIKYDMTFNGQVIMLEHLLNDKFDNTERRIYIEDTEQKVEVLLYNKVEENEKTYIYNISESEPKTYIYNKAEFDAQFDFTVFVPSELTGYEIEMNFLLNKYKLAGTRYLIQTI
jgi:hypothetical protein